MVGALSRASIEEAVQWIRTGNDPIDFANTIMSAYIEAWKWGPHYYAQFNHKIEEFCKINRKGIFQGEPFYLWEASWKLRVDPEEIALLSLRQLGINKYQYNYIDRHTFMRMKTDLCDFCALPCEGTYCKECVKRHQPMSINLLSENERVARAGEWWQPDWWRQPEEQLAAHIEKGRRFYAWGTFPEQTGPPPQEYLDKKKRLEKWFEKCIIHSTSLTRHHEGMPNDGKEHKHYHDCDRCGTQYLEAHKWLEYGHSNYEPLLCLTCTKFAIDHEGKVNRGELNHKLPPGYYLANNKYNKPTE